MITFSFESKGKKRQAADLLVVPFWKGKQRPAIAYPDDQLLSSIRAPIDAGDFEGSEGEKAVLYVQGQPEKKIVLLGLGEANAATAETLRRAYGALCKWAHHQKSAKEWNLLFPGGAKLEESEVLRGIAEGLLIPNSSSEFLREKDKPSLVEKVHFHGAPGKAKEQVAPILHQMEAVYFARALINDNADRVTPSYLARQAKEIAKRSLSMKVTILNRKQIEKEKLGLVASVGRAGMHEPQFIILEYKGNARSKDCTALVGKGVTYDTGGLNLKPTGFMETMRSDMSGGAAILGTMMALAKMNWRGNVVAVIPCVENAIDAHSYKPGDVYTSYAGHTIEIANTDAEGRLILADAIAYAKKKFKPQRIIDIATLTGACVIALGSETIALFSNNDQLAKAFEEAGQETFERVWRMPLYPEYKELIKSDIADYRNVQKNRQAGAIVAAKFIEVFVEDTPWVHLDIAGKGFLEENKRYFPKFGVGVGIRLIIRALEKLSRS